ncbi:MAG: hypothetical protein L0Y56_13940 [Nitrospira sp.]|nr:hypothetical protein [Nitrospira sp.]
MKMQKRIITGIFFCTFVMLISFLSAEAQQKLVLKAGPVGKGASGEAVIKDLGQDQKEITIEAKGLKPNAVYTVWLVNMKPKMDMVGVGTGDYLFKSDDKGNGHYSANVSAAELEKWQVLEIAYHPDGDPKNMKKMEIALEADIR